MIFVDTGAWIALSDKSDQYHRDALSIYAGLSQGGEFLMTTNYVIGETVTRLRYDASHAVAVRFLNLMGKTEKAGSLRISEIDEELFKKAVTIFCKYDTVLLSFVDCTSFAICQKHNIQEAFAFDQHFTMMGITLCAK